MGPKGLIPLDSALQGVEKLGLDSPPFIYFMESHPKFDAVLTSLFQRIAAGRPKAVVSSLILTEVLVHPLRRGAAELEVEYRDLLTRSANLELLPVGVAIAQRAAQLRARYGIRTPDALHIATALEAGCQAFLTNDSRLRQVGELRVLLLSEIEP